MSIDLHAIALASGCMASRQFAEPPTERQAPPAKPPPATEDEEAPTQWRPVDLASLSIAPRGPIVEWTPPPSAEPAPPRHDPFTPREPIDLAALSIAPRDTAQPLGKKARRWRAKHADLYDISEEELAERLAARRAQRRQPSRTRGDLTAQHRIAMAMEPRYWYTSPMLRDLTDMPLRVVSANLAKMQKWPRLYLEKREWPYREQPYRVEAPFGRGGRTLRTPTQFMYRLTETGLELRLEGLEFAARDAE